MAITTGSVPMMPGGQRRAGALDAAREKQVVDDVAHCGELERFQPIGAGEVAQALPVEPGEWQRIRPNARYSPNDCSVAG